MAKRKTRKGEGAMTSTDPAEKATGDAPVVVSAAAAQQEDEEWVITFSGQTGEVVKVQKIDKATGQRTELTEQEYAGIGGLDLSGMGDYEDQSGYGADAYADPYGLEEAYYQGMADLQSMMGMTDDASAYADPSYGMTPEEQAYYQGMQDYIDACGM